MQRALDGAVVAMVMTRCTPTALARSSTAARSSWNLSSSRWAWVSIRGRVTSGHRDGLGGVYRHRFQRLKVLPFHGEIALHQRQGLRVADAGRVLGQSINAAADVVHQARHQGLDRDEIPGGETLRIRGE